MIKLATIPFLLALLSGGKQKDVAAPAIAPIVRRIPPAGIEIPLEIHDELESRLRQLEGRHAVRKTHRSEADVAVLLKAVRFALLHGEFYDKRDFAKAGSLLDLAATRLDELADGSTPWTEQRGLVVRGYRSSIDASAQPYGLVIPEAHRFDRPAPLYVWLHGRGDKTTDMHFLAQRRASQGSVAPANAIVLHPFGRHCMGFKSAGEIDVLDAVAHVQEQYRIDRDRIVLMGFSMGGAGVWHLGAHYADRWVAMSPGAGFAETARYIRLEKQDYPAWYQQKLWGNYDVPNYVRNLFNLRVVAYSGERDKQIQAARVMEEAFQEHGEKLTHLIGPKMGHKYHPEVLQQILRLMDEAARVGINRTPRRVHLQTQTLRYNRMHWVELVGLKQHWNDARVDAERIDEKRLRVTTRNATALRLTADENTPVWQINIDGQIIPPVRFADLPVAPGKRAAKAVNLVRGADDQWAVAPRKSAAKAVNSGQLVKQHGLQGPIDDVWLAPFLVVTPSQACRHPRVQRWMEFELAHLQTRWRALFRGDVRIKKDEDVTPEDLKRFHLVVWGDDRANSVLRRMVDRLPVDWQESTLRVGSKTYPAAAHVPVLIYPNPLNPNKYVVLNSGPTFREAHDRTNSLQNPKLPDWAVLGLEQEPSAEAPGRVVSAGFFDERWQ